MADNKITFSLGSIFTGQGFSKANNALRKTAQNAKKTGGAFSRMGASLAKARNSILKNLVNIQAGFQMITGLAGKIVGVFSKAFEFEKMTVQFKSLIGDMDSARDHMQMLKEMGDTPPFSLDEFAKTSRAMLTTSDGVLGYKKSLEMVGDTAAATGQPIEMVGQAVGRMYALIRDGEPISRAAMQLRNVGILTPEVVAQMEDMQKAGASTADIWAKLEGALEKYKGAMAETEKTGSGFIGVISSRWDNIVRQFSQAMSGDMKGGLSSVLDVAKELEQSGAIERWAVKAGSAIKEIVEIAKVAFGWLGKLGDWYTSTKDFLEYAGAGVSSFIGALSSGGSLQEARSMGAQTMIDYKKEQRDRKIEEEKRIAETIAARKKAEAEAARQAAENEKKEKQRIAAQLAEADKKLAEKAAKEQKKRDQEAHEKRLAQLEKERRAREKEEKAKHEKMLKNDAENKEREAKDHANRQIKEIDNQIADIDKRIADVDAVRKKTQEGIAADQKYHAGIAGEGYKYSLDENGNVNNFKDFSRAERYRKRAERDQKNQNKDFDGRAQKKFEELEEKQAKGKYISDSDKKFLEQYRKFDKERKGKKALEEEKKNLEARKEAERKKLQKDVADIREDLKKALEVN